jgi:hypothetical protein
MIPHSNIKAKNSWLILAVILSVLLLSGCFVYTVRVVPTVTPRPTKEKATRTHVEKPADLVTLTDGAQFQVHIKWIQKYYRPFPGMVYTYDQDYRINAIPLVLNPAQGEDAYGCISVQIPLEKTAMLVRQLRPVNDNPLNRPTIGWLDRAITRVTLTDGRVLEGRLGSFSRGDFHDPHAIRGAIGKAFYSEEISQVERVVFSHEPAAETMAAITYFDGRFAEKVTLLAFMFEGKPTRYGANFLDDLILATGTTTVTVPVEYIQSIQLEQQKSTIVKWGGKRIVGDPLDPDLQIFGLTTYLDFFAVFQCRFANIRSIDFK